MLYASPYIDGSCCLDRVDDRQNLRRVSESGSSLPYCDASLNTALGPERRVGCVPLCVPSYFCPFPFFFSFTYICLDEHVAGILTGAPDIPPPQSGSEYRLLAASTR